MANKKGVTISLGGLPFTLTIVFLILQLCNVITWSWWWVFSPLWIPVGIVLGLLICILISAMVLGIAYAIWNTLWN